MANPDAQDHLAALAPEPAATSLPDYLTSPDAVSADDGVQWRFGKAPNYSNTRKVWADSKKANHEPGTLAEMAENLVKNWEVEASFKLRLQDWRTVDHANYSFAMNGECPQSAEHMLRVGTYNAVIPPNGYYCPKYSDFASSHKTFKRMMPTFAWEVIEVYSGRPKISFKWRHWGVMKNDYVGFNDKGEKVTAKAHGGPIEIFGVTVATVDDKYRLQIVDTYMDPSAMFRQIAPDGIVDKAAVNRNGSLADSLNLSSKTSAVTVAEDEIDNTEKPNQAATVELERSCAGSETGTSMIATPSLGTCAFHRQINLEPINEQRDVIASETADVTATIWEHSAGPSQPSKKMDGLSEHPEPPANMIEPVSNMHVQEIAKPAAGRPDETHRYIAVTADGAVVGTMEDHMTQSHGEQAKIGKGISMTLYDVDLDTCSSPVFVYEDSPSAVADHRETEQILGVCETGKERRADESQEQAAAKCVLARRHSFCL